MSADRVAAVTGASGPMGQAIIAALSDSATTVGLSRRRPEDVKPDRFIETDVTDPEDVDAAISAIEGHYGRLDVLVNCAGAGTPRADLQDYDLTEWRRILDINVTGSFQVLRAAAPLLRASPQGRVVNISSMVGIQPLPRIVAYATSKSAIIGLTKEVARELAPGCTVNAVAPGYMDAGMATPILADSEYAAFVHDRTPAKRLGRMSEVGALVRFLCSEDAGFITGQVIVIDGGWTLV